MGRHRRQLPKQHQPNVLGHLVSRQLGDNVQNFSNNLFHERLRIAKNLYKKDLVSHYGCVNAIEFSQEGELLVSGGDDRRVLLWHVDKSILKKELPVSMQKQHLSNIFCLGMDSRNTRIFSGGNDDVVIVHDIQTRESVDVFLHSKPVYGLSIDPSNDDLFATAGEDGKILIFDMRDSSDVMCVSRCRSPYHAVMHHPYDAGFIVTANAKEGAALWDLRAPKMPTIRYGGQNAAQSCMSVRFNSLGTQVLALRRRLPPILFSTASPEPVCQFYHPDYYNSCTMKSCCFAGERDQFVLSGSDDFNLYVWRVTDADVDDTDQWVDRNQMVLYGHRSIVNQVRYNPQKCLIASSGVEKIVKLWTPFELESWSGSLVEEATGPENPREVFTNEEYISLNMTHDYSHQSTLEDPRMMAFFDYLVQQEIEGWNSETSDQSSEHSSDENESSRPDTTQTSDTESVQNYIPMRGQQQARRGDVTQRTKYRNRIAYLIATKRNRLKRLALKTAANARATNRRTITKAKYGLRNQPKRSGLGALRSSRKGIGKRNRRLSTSKYNKRCPVSHEQTSDSEVSKSTKKRRMQTTNLNLAVYRTYRRKSKGTPSSSNTSTRVEESSSDDDDGDNDSEQPQPSAAKKLKLSEDSLANMPSTSRGFPSSFGLGGGSSSSSCYNNGAGPSGLCNAVRTRGGGAGGNAGMGGSGGSSTYVSMDTPSTSTGLTGNGRNLLFHIASTTNDDDDDSDDDPSIPEHPASPDNLLRVITSPINHFELPPNSSELLAVDYNDNNILDHSNNNSSYVNHNNNNNNNSNNNTSSRIGHLNSNAIANGSQKRTSSGTTAAAAAADNNNESSSSYNQVYDHTYSSRSNSRLSSSYDYDCSSSNDSFVDYFTNKKKLLASVAASDQLQPEGSTASMTGSIRKPDYNREMLNYTPDSGIATGPCSSVSTNGVPSSIKSLTPLGSSATNGGSSNGNYLEPTPGTSGLTSTGVGSVTTNGNNGIDLGSKLFQQKVARVRKNYRKHFCDDSDSE
ncbi:DDB1- and CUL4-associated factor 5 [Wyeomyia smithii]|uniref:DDB1- and CUL4-associated factor 5 n=1 Tax=Wyeomyia smithii TaxID=174621 RepID=UPI0024681C83|nr:DDB1- and CUL4-associated factor 5 [Wyeomyia smithii]XP_055551184.1 DDB1- and CUL4-associated factor 5 [Wyeomyia smithii]XP_055551185.1 DDB1- and CUL4-associated factor 5 [Wyeomyia smithii]XP_055551186.1 DDB1- and CUL4-associated factor 5 [Wyeomyia smithii]XP_055551187.1 DDB1- and CUL4-associated factor 5 [Wyeomyia smithii]